MRFLSDRYRVLPPLENSLGDGNSNIFRNQWPTRRYEKEGQAQLWQWMRDGKLATTACFHPTLSHC